MSLDVGGCGRSGLCEAVRGRQETPDARVFAGVLATGMDSGRDRPSPLAAMEKNGHGGESCGYSPFLAPVAQPDRAADF